MNCCAMDADPEPIDMPSTEDITGFYFEVLNALRGNTAGHPAYGSFSYHKAAEYYALFGDNFYNYPTWYTNVGTRPPPGFEQLPSANSKPSNNNPMPKSSGNGTEASMHGRNPSPNTKGNNCTNKDFSQQYLTMLRKHIPNLKTLLQKRQVEGNAQAKPMPIEGAVNGNNNALTQAYAQLLLSNIRHQAMLQQQLQQEQQRQLKQNNATAASLSVLYESVMLQQHALIQQKKVQLQQQALQQRAQQKPRIPRAIYGRNQPQTLCNY